MLTGPPVIIGGPPDPPMSRRERTVWGVILLAALLIPVSAYFARPPEPTPICYCVGGGHLPCGCP